jgi:hypothetical protein
MNEVAYPLMDPKEIRKRLIQLGYDIIDGNYQSMDSKKPVFLGLILQKGDNESVLADIRQFEGQVILPYRGKIVPERLSKLIQDLNQTEIPFRPFESRA